MGKKAKIQKGPRRAIATTSVASKNDTLGIASERDSIKAEQVAKAKAEAETKAAALAEEKALAEKKAKTRALQNATLLDSDELFDNIESGGVAGGRWEDAAEDSAMQTITIARNKLSKRKRFSKSKLPGPVDPVLSIKKLALGTALELLTSLGLVDSTVVGNGLEDKESEEGEQPEQPEPLVRWSDVDKTSIAKVWRRIRNKPRLKGRLLMTFLELEELGFRRVHIALALKRCGFDAKACVEWLVLHIPEESLPAGWETFQEQQQGNSLVVELNDGGGTSSNGRNTYRQNNSSSGIDRINAASNIITPQINNSGGGKNKSKQQKAPTSSKAAEISDELKSQTLAIIARQLQETETETAATKEQSPAEQEPMFETPSHEFQFLKRKFTALRLDCVSKKSKNSKSEMHAAIKVVKSRLQKLQASHAELKELDIVDRKDKDATTDDKDGGIDLEEDAGQGVDGLGGLFSIDQQQKAEVAGNGSKPRVCIDLGVESGVAKKPDPTRLLEQHVRQVWGSKNISYHWTNLGIEMFTATVSFKHWTFAMEEHEHSPSQKLASNYIALKALYYVAKDRQYHLQMSKKAQKLWIGWKEEEAANEEARLREQSASTLQIIASLVKENVALTEKFKPAPNKDAGTTDADLDEGEVDIQVIDGEGAEGNDGESSNNTSCRRKHRKMSDEQVRKLVKERVSSAAYQEYEVGRSELPVMSIANDMITALEHHDVLIVSGTTGSGKTTQIPHLLLVHEALYGAHPARTNVIVTEPRRISAVSVAERVSVEFGENGGPGSPGSLVGYQIRGQKALAPATCMVRYCTTGVILRLLVSDPLILNFSHVVIDEVHERTVDGDLILVILKRVVAQRRTMGNPLKVVVMSATIDLEKLSAYFDDAPVVQAGGRTFPVVDFPLEDAIQLSGYHCGPDSECSLSRGRGRWRESTVAYNQDGSIRREGVFNDYELGDAYATSTANSVANVDESRINYDLIERLLLLLTDERVESGDDPARLLGGRGPVESKFLAGLKALRENVDEANSNAVLVFFPGLSQIQQMYDRLASHPRFAKKDRFLVLRLHSSLSSQAEQRKVFAIPRNGLRKIILSTNVAETGVTIPDVCFVIDTARVKELNFRAKSKIHALEEVFVSKASLKQRAGRAGRVRPGISFQLVTSHLRDETLHDFARPEILRSSLEAVILQIMTVVGEGDPWKFLATCLDPPTTKSIDAAVNTLEVLGALERIDLDEDEISARGGTAHGASSTDLKLTPLGANLAKLPVDAKVGKLLLFGCLFQCLDPILTVAASIGSEDQKVFVNESDSNTKTLRAKFTHPTSDLLTFHLVYRAWLENEAAGGDERYFCRNFSLSLRSLTQIRKTKAELLGLLQASGFCPTSACVDNQEDEVNRNAGNEELLAGVLCAGLFPSICRPVVPRSNSGLNSGKKKQPQLIYLGSGDERVSLSSSSTNKDMLGPEEPLTGLNEGAKTGILCYLKKMKTGKTLLYDSTFIPPVGLVLLTAAKLDLVPQNRTLLVDDWVPMHVSPKHAVVLKKLRVACNEFLEDQFQHPDPVVFSQLVGLIQNILVY